MLDHPIPRTAHPGVDHAHLQRARGPVRDAWAVLQHLPFEERLARAVAAGQPFFPDLSEHNGAVNWDQLAAAWRAGLLEAVAMRAGFGTVRADAQFARNQAEARRRGIPNIAYWFCYSAYNSAAAEAAMFNRMVGTLRPGEAMAGDFEDDPNARPFVRGAAGLRWCQDFLGALQAPQNATWGYSYPALISAVGLQPLWQTWPFWLADWSATPDSAFGYATLRQFTDCGSTPGVGGCCDQSRVLRAPLSRWLTPGGDPGEDDMPLTEQIATGLAHTALRAFLPGLDDPKMLQDYSNALLANGNFGDLVQQLDDDSLHPDQSGYNAPALLGALRALQQQVADLDAKIANLSPGPVDDDHIAAVAAAAAVAEIERRLENG